MLIMFINFHKYPPFYHLLTAAIIPIINNNANNNASPTYHLPAIAAIILITKETVKIV